MNQFGKMPGLLGKGGLVGLSVCGDAFDRKNRD